MKTLTGNFILFVTAWFFTLGALSAQGDLLTREEKLIGSSSDFLIGLHSGIFDCNQDYNYPYNLGIVGQYNYTPNVLKNWFMGAEIGAFFAQNGLDGNNREMGTLISHLSIYPGISFDLNKREYPEEEDLSQKLKSKKLKFAVGVTLGVPIKTFSTGIHYDPDNAKTGIGFTAMSIFEMSPRLSFFGSITRVGADMDGFGYYPESGDLFEGNKHKLSYWAKIGLAYNLMAR